MEKLLYLPYKKNSFKYGRIYYKLKDNNLRLGEIMTSVWRFRTSNSGKNSMSTCCLESTKNWRKRRGSLEKMKRFIKAMKIMRPVQSQIKNGRRTPVSFFCLFPQTLLVNVISLRGISLDPYAKSSLGTTNVECIGLF